MIVIQTLLVVLILYVISVAMLGKDEDLTPNEKRRKKYKDFNEDMKDRNDSEFVKSLKKMNSE